ncbi:MAG: phosphoribosylglycinamide formyltransferase [Spirochaetaceae bacterium]|jgi:phosphoribosylglycinamide formyltransferase-1|nr:phosphoribosylglycinamide formyltransferase [Spirochaetaceae bacterium]
MSNTKKRTAVLVSGGGTNLQAIINAASRGELPHSELSLVVSSEPDAYALRRAKEAGIPSRILSQSGFCRCDFFDKASYSQSLLQILDENRIDAVVLAGFLVILDEPLLSAYQGRIINVHPSLIPAFCGEGFHGLFVHEAALKRGVKISGATVHLVNNITDGGAILMQKAVAVRDDDTPETLQRRVMEEAEWVILPRALEALCASF